MHRIYTYVYGGKQPMKQRIDVALVMTLPNREGKRHNLPQQCDMAAVSVIRTHNGNIAVPPNLNSHKSFI